MTEPSNNTDNPATRPISVAELLAKNGSIGAPAPGGRRRRRRGNADAVTVAELTGEIPIIRIDEPVAEEPVVEEPVAEEPVVEAPTAEEPVIDDLVADQPTAEEPVIDDPVIDEPVIDEIEAPEVDTPETGEVAEETAADTDEADEAAEALESDSAVESDYEAHLQQRDAEPEPITFEPRRRLHGLTRRIAGPHDGAAEEMSPDPLHDDDSAEAEKPSYLRSPSDTLFGGTSVADEATRRTRTPGPEDIDLDGTVSDGNTEFLYSDDQAEQGSPFMRGLWIVAQSVLAVALGAGLFIAFDQLWKWNNIVALALSVLVILGLVVGVRVVRKTEDIASTLIAVAVGAMVTLGPLALLQST